MIILQLHQNHCSRVSRLHSQPQCTPQTTATGSTPRLRVSLCTPTRDYKHTAPYYTHKNKTVISIPLTQSYTQKRQTDHTEAVVENARKTVMHFSHLVHKCPKYCKHQFIDRNTISPTTPPLVRLSQAQRIRGQSEDRSGSSSPPIRTRAHFTDRRHEKSRYQSQG